MKLKIHESFEPCLYGKRETIKEFINKAVSYFTGRNIVPTIDQVEDYVTSDRWAKVNISDGEIGYAKDGFEYIQLDDLCKNIQNLCSFNLDDIRESNAKNHWYTISNVEPPLAREIRDYLRYNGLKFEEFKEGSNYSYDVNCTEEEYSEIRDVIDGSDWTYITKGTGLKFESLLVEGQEGILEELNSLPVYTPRKSNYTDLLDYEKVIDKFEDGTVIGMDWSAGPCYFMKVHGISWKQLISPHYDLDDVTKGNVAKWLCDRGAWCKKPLWLDSVETFENLAAENSNKGYSGGFNFFGPSDKKNYGNKPGFYGF